MITAEFRAFLVTFEALLGAVFTASIVQLMWQRWMKSILGSTCGGIWRQVKTPTEYTRQPNAIVYAVAVLSSFAPFRTRFVV